MGPLTAAITAFAWSEYVAAVSGVARMMMPAVMFIPFAIWYRNSLEWPGGLWWLLFVAVLLGNVAASSIACSFDNIRSWIFGLALYVPLAYMAFSPPGIDKFSRYYFQSAALLGTVWVWYHYMTSAQDLGPYSLDFAPGGGMQDLNMLWPIILGMGKQARGWPRLWCWGLTALNMVAVFLLFSRTMLFAMIIIAAVLLFYENKFVFFGLIVLALIIVACLPSYVVHEYLAWYRFVDYEADSSRSMIRRLALTSIEQNMFLGIGTGNVRYVLYGVKQYYGAHNAMVTVAVEIGVIGAMLMVMFEAYALYTAARLAFLGGIGPYYTGAITAFFAGSLTDDWIHRPGETVLLVIILMSARLLLRTRGDPILSAPRQVRLELRRA